MLSSSIRSRRWDGANAVPSKVLKIWMERHLHQSGRFWLLLTILMKFPAFLDFLMNLKWEIDHSVEIAKWKYAKGESVLKSCETSPCELSPSKLGRTPYYIFHTWMVSPLCDSACEHCAVLQSWSSCYTVGRGRAWIHCALSRGSPSCKPHQRSLGRKNTWMALSPGACDCAAQNCPDNLVPYCTHHIWTPQLPSTL